MSDEIELMQLRARVAELEERLEFLYKRLGVVYAKDSAEADRRVLEVLKTGNLIEAIKVYREIYNVGLAEAKQAVEELQRRHS